MFNNPYNNMLWGKHRKLRGDGLSVIESMVHPDGGKMSWPGNDGILVTMWRKIELLEEELKKEKARK